MASQSRGAGAWAGRCRLHTGTPYCETRSNVLMMLMQMLMMRVQEVPGLTHLLVMLMMLMVVSERIGNTEGI